MIKASIDLQDLRRGIYVKAKAEPSWRFWGLYVHVCKMETLREAYEMAKKNDGAPGVDGVTFEAIEAQGADALLEQIRDELIGRTYKPLPTRRQARTTSPLGTPASASASSKTGWRRRSGAIWRVLGNDRASAGSDGIGGGCTTLFGCLTAIECDGTC